MEVPGTNSRWDTVRPYYMKLYIYIIRIVYIAYCSYATTPWFMGIVPNEIIRRRCIICEEICELFSNVSYFMLCGTLKFPNTRVVRVI